MIFGIAVITFIQRCERFILQRLRIPTLVGFFVTLFVVLASVGVLYMMSQTV